MRRRRADSADARLIRGTMLRIGLQSAAAVLVTVVLLSAAAILVVLHTQHDDQNTLLGTAIAQADDVTDPPAGTWLVLRRDGRTQASPGLPPGLPDHEALDQVQVDGISRTADIHAHLREYRVRTERHSDEVVQAAMDLSQAHRERSRLVEALLVTGGAGLVLAALTGAWVARRAVTPLVGALALQRRFVADAGHELRTPLTLLSTRAQMLRRRLRGHPAEPDVDGLVTDASQLAAILDDLLLAADPRQEVPRQPVDLTELLREAVAAAQPTAEEKGVQLDLADQPVRVRGFDAGLRRAINALLDNGIRHAHSLVEVTLQRHGHQVRIDVTDDGPGIDAEILPTLFTRFASAPTETAPGQRRRYGLGLSLVSEIAARHGGSVSARNGGHGGATLSMQLPIGMSDAR
ncbi:sensor histidine kinase [Nocardia miyunensis]|uniref:sensor histidine kinase n=1 Tax=Nocardia miyunensis TaxID=282684 RepID=UPI000A06CFBF|nr:HAMP domain-containing sensor histidine kinase [Nocardia miyunensis]